MTGVLTELFSNSFITVYERKEATLFGLRSYYWWSYLQDPSKVVGPFDSALAATSHFERAKAEKEAYPNVIHLNFRQKARMVSSPTNFTPAFTICQCGQHYDEGLRQSCPNCGKPPVKLL